MEKGKRNFEKILVRKSITNQGMPATIKFRIFCLHVS